MMDQENRKIQRIREVLKAQVNKAREQQLNQLKNELDNLENKELEEAREKAENILAKANEESIRIKKLAVAQARFAKDRDLMKAREAKVNKLMEEIGERLGSFRQEKGYEDFLLHLIREAIEVIPDKELILHMNEEDRKLYQEKLYPRIADRYPDRKINLSTSHSDFNGGVVVESSLRNIRVDNTFELSLNNIKDQVGRDLYRIMIRG